jgi:hypothetical protein
MNALQADAPRTRTNIDVRIIDFVEMGHPALLRMWEKRQRGTVQGDNGWQTNPR